MQVKVCTIYSLNNANFNTTSSCIGFGSICCD